MLLSAFIQKRPQAAISFFLGKLYEFFLIFICEGVGSQLPGKAVIYVLGDTLCPKRI